MTVYPKISVIIPIYNTGIHLRKCLDSIVNQTYSNLDIILVDDGSTDGSGAVCDEYAAKDNRVTVIHQQNGGVSKARNAGIEIATGNYYNFPDSDDYLELDSYEYLLKLIEEHHCDAVNYEYYITYPNQEKQHMLSDEWYGLFDAEGAHNVMWNGEPFACNKLYSAKLVTGHDLSGTTKETSPLKFREDIFRGEDSFFAHAALERAERVWFDKRPLYHYVQSEQSACRGHFRVNQLSAMKLYDAYQELFKGKYNDMLKKLPTWQCSLCITLYYDMWRDERPFNEERQMVFEHFCKMYSMATIISLKAKIKMCLFRISPKLFCLFHKYYH